MSNVGCACSLARGPVPVTGNLTQAQKDDPAVKKALNGQVGGGVLLGAGLAGILFGALAGEKMIAYGGAGTAILGLGLVMLSRRVGTSNASKA